MTSGFYQGYDPASGCAALLCVHDLTSHKGGFEADPEKQNEILLSSGGFLFNVELIR